MQRTSLKGEACRLGVLVGLTLTAFWPALRAGFVWDDALLLENNTRYRGIDGDLLPLDWMFTTLHSGHYHPLTWLSYWCDYVVWGMEPLGYHLTNLALHAVCAVLLYRLIRAVQAAVGRSAPWAAVGGALLFAVHPLRVESVVWVTERRDVLSTAFMLLAVLAYVRLLCGAPRRLVAWGGVSLACFAGSLLSKAWGVTLPVGLLALDHYLIARATAWAGRPLRWRVALVLKLPYLLVAAPFLYVAPIAQRTTGALLPLDVYGLGARMIQAARALWFYPAKTLWPAGLSPIHEITDYAPSPTPAVGVALAAALVVTLALLRLRDRWPAAWSAWLFYGVTISPVLGLFQSGPQWAADRYAYVACLPAALLFAGALAGRSPRWGAAAALVLLALAALSVEQSRHWHDRLTLWEHAVRASPDSPTAHYNLAQQYKKAGRLQEAAAAYHRHRELLPSPRSR